MSPGRRGTLSADARASGQALVPDKVTYAGISLATMPGGLKASMQGAGRVKCRWPAVAEMLAIDAGLIYPEHCTT